MNTRRYIMNARMPAVATLAGAALLAACAGTPKAPEGAVRARASLTQLQSNEALASRASVPIEEADKAVRLAEKTHGDK
jgi:hypothetical protein